MQFAAALPLGFSSQCELLDAWLHTPLDPDLARQRLAAKMAPGLTIQRVTEVPLSAPPLQTLTREATYKVSIAETLDKTALRQRIETLLASEAHTRELTRGKKRKVYDLRPLIIAILLHEQEAQRPALIIRLCLMEAKNGRPDEVLRALGLDPALAQVERTEIVLDQPGP